MNQFIYDLPDWPQFTWDASAIIVPLSEVRNKQGILIGKMDACGFDMKSEAYLENLSKDVIKTSEIEGEMLDNQQVRSSIARKLGIEIGGLVDSNHNVDGIVEMMLDATQHWNKALNQERLFAWHASLFPNGRSGMQKITVGNWRNDAKGPMQVVSGPIGKETVHFIAPAATKIKFEIQQFLNWINDQNNATDPVLAAAISHLWFITIHPFDDGNGRMARAITDMMLCRSENQSQRFYSISTEIEQNKNQYYDLLESTQKGSMDITSWLLWFISCLSTAIDASSSIVHGIMVKHKFWNDHKMITFNRRQTKMIEMLFGDFFGHLTTSKWAKINKCSQDTALRDIHDLVEKRVLKKSNKGGRSTNYELIV